VVLEKYALESELTVPENPRRFDVLKDPRFDVPSDPKLEPDLKGSEKRELAVGSRLSDDLDSVAFASAVAENIGT